MGLNKNEIKVLKYINSYYRKRYGNGYLQRVGVSELMGELELNRPILNEALKYLLKKKLITQFEWNSPFNFDGYLITEKGNAVARYIKEV